MPLPAGLFGQRTGEEGLADARRATNQHILVRRDPVAGHQAGEQSSVETPRMAEIDILWRRPRLEFGAFEASGVQPGLSFCGFAVEQHAEALFEAELKEKKLLMSQGTLIDATLIAAPCSTKNRARERDPEMHSVKKGKQWYFGMRAHIGADESSGLVHAVVSTVAHESEVSQVASLLHGEESRVGADAGCVGAAKRPEVIAKRAETGQMIGGCIARCRQAIHQMADGWQKN